jgi:hypothetical protein
VTPSVVLLRQCPLQSPSPTSSESRSPASAIQTFAILEGSHSTKSRPSRHFWGCDSAATFSKVVDFNFRLFLEKVERFSWAKVEIWKAMVCWPAIKVWQFLLIQRIKYDFQSSFVNVWMDHFLPEIRKSVQDFTEIEVETQIGAWTWRIFWSFRSHACADMDTMHWN